ncbi:MAG: GNAT family N-acetyltransferase [Ignavibacteria bacterium]
MITLRLQQIHDAQRFFEILNNPNFLYFGSQPESVEAEIAWLEGNDKRFREHKEWNYTILKGEEIVGGIGVKINQHRSFIGEIGYFIDEAYWGQGIATEAVKLMEEICMRELRMTRIELLMLPENIGSERVAIKSGYRKEGLLQKALLHKDGSKRDCYLYAKTL